MDFTNIEYVFFDLDGTLIDSNDFQNNLDIELVHLFDKNIKNSEIIEERDNFLKKNKRNRYISKLLWNYKEKCSQKTSKISGREKDFETIIYTNIYT